MRPLFLIACALLLTYASSADAPEDMPEGLKLVTHNELVRMEGDVIAIYWDSDSATSEHKDTLKKLSNISQAMALQGQHPIFLVSKQNQENAEAFKAAHLQSPPSLIMHLHQENVTELMDTAFDIAHISAFILDRINKGNLNDIYAFISEEDLLDYYETNDRKPILLFFISKMCKTCSQNLISVQRLATMLKSNLSVFLVNCDGTLDENNYCSRMLMRKFPHTMLLADDVFTSFNGTYTTHAIGGWAMNELTPERKDARKREWADHTKEIFNSVYYEEVGKNAYDKKGRPKEWPMKPNIKRTQQQINDLENRIKKLEAMLDDMHKE